VIGGMVIGDWWIGDWCYGSVQKTVSAEINLFFGDDSQSTFFAV